MPFFKDLDWGIWLQSIIAAFISGGASAITAAFTVSQQDPKDYYIGSTKFWMLGISVFVVSGIVSVCAFLKQSPLPPPEVKETTVSKIEVKDSPPAPPVTTVTTLKITETKSPDQEGNH